MKKIVMAIAVALALLVAACGGDDKSSTSSGGGGGGGGGGSSAAPAGADVTKCGTEKGKKAAGTPIKLGAIATKQPGTDFTGIPNAAKAYFDCVNDNGGIKRHPIEYVIETEQTDPGQNASLARKRSRARRSPASSAGSASSTARSTTSTTSRRASTSSMRASRPSVTGHRTAPA